MGGKMIFEGCVFQCKAVHHHCSRESHKPDHRLRSSLPSGVGLQSQWGRPEGPFQYPGGNLRQGASASLGNKSENALPSGKLGILACKSPNNKTDMSLLVFAEAQT